MFDFAQPDRRRAGEFSGPWPAYIHPASRERIKIALAEGCDCKLLLAPTATLRRRTGGGGTSIWLQCDGCGRALSNALPRAEHPDAARYPLWDEALPRQYQAALRAYWDDQRAAVPTPEQVREQSVRDYLAKSRAYSEWLRTSPEWKLLTEKVRWRSRGFCEACLVKSAELVVHHLTYDHGKIPPAWELRAVCCDCHDRMHTTGDDWCDLGMARTPGGGL